MSSRSNGVMNVWFSLVRMSCVISSPRCSMVLSCSTRDSTSFMSCRMDFSRRAPSVRLSAISENISKNLAGLGRKRTMCLPAGEEPLIFELMTISRDGFDGQQSVARCLGDSATGVVAEPRATAGENLRRCPRSHGGWLRDRVKQEESSSGRMLWSDPRGWGQRLRNSRPLTYVHPDKQAWSSPEALPSLEPCSPAQSACALVRSRCRADQVHAPHNAIRHWRKRAHP